jgi:hypothetical protein
VIFGIYPRPLLDIINAAMAGLMAALR